MQIYSENRGATANRGNHCQHYRKWRLFSLHWCLQIYKSRRLPVTESPVDFRKADECAVKQHSVRWELHITLCEVLLQKSNKREPNVADRPTSGPDVKENERQREEDRQRGGWCSRPKWKRRGGFSRCIHRSWPEEDWMGRLSVIYDSETQIFPGERR